MVDTSRIWWQKKYTRRHILRLSTMWRFSRSPFWTRHLRKRSARFSKTAYFGNKYNLIPFLNKFLYRYSELRCQQQSCTVSATANVFQKCSTSDTAIGHLSVCFELTVTTYTNHQIPHTSAMLCALSVAKYFEPNILN